MSFFAEGLVTGPDIWESLPWVGDRRALRLLTARTIEKWRTGSAHWPASAASRAREGSSCSSRPVTTAEPIISSVERVRRFRAESRSRSQSLGGIRPAHRHCSTGSPLHSRVPRALQRKPSAPAG